ncbi:MAG: phosphoribosylamine--glycine ligase [Gammaproteobacteria bacterium]|nr:phosphoribosylamine--glycine ligase [Gammaproteobacteria bacterium]
MKNKILIIGSGAREHAIAKSLDKSHHKKELFCLASNLNPGIANICKEIVVDNINDPNIVKNYAQKVNATFAIIGPENPLENGVSDTLWNHNIPVVGPKKNMAKIETSKVFTRNLQKKYNIPGAPKYKFFKTLDGLKNTLKNFGNNYVVKYDGLAGGKGVKVSGDHLKNHAEALEYCKKLIKKNGTFIIEEKFIGEEFSLMSFCDGKKIKHMPAVQDHKRAYEGDLGPNTGGMGTYSDSNHSLPFLNKTDIEKAQEINKKTVAALKNHFNEEYKGILYGGFIATTDGIKLIEYNARFGDPEVMNVLSILKSDFIDVCKNIINGSLNKFNIEFENKATVCKYSVPKGYPDKPVKNMPINVSKIKNNDLLFYASVDMKNGTLIESGSRTIAVVGKANSIFNAEKIAEKEICSISGPLFHRKDIGTKSIIEKRISHMKSLR